MKMVELTAIQGFSAATPPIAGATPDAEALRVEFDALILQMLIKSSGLLDAADSGGAGSLAMGDMLAYPLARQLAEQVDLGFGSMVIRMSEANTGEVKHD
jgi:hypothetical protein